jgi:hypothetical protein
VSAINNAGQITGKGLDEDLNVLAIILTPNPGLPGDFNCDQVVDVDDLLGVIKSWGITGGGPADFNGDQTVSLPDLLIVIDNWTV